GIIHQSVYPSKSVGYGLHRIGTLLRNGELRDNLVRPATVGFHLCDHLLIVLFISAHNYGAGPSRANTCVIPFPMPLPPPVTTMTLSTNPKSILFAIY